MPEIYLLGGHMKDMKDRVRRAISAVAVREHWRMRRVLLLVMVAVTVLGMVTVSSMADAVQPRRCMWCSPQTAERRSSPAVPAGA